MEIGHHEVSLIGRQNLVVSGVSHVEHFDSHEIVVETNMGLLVIGGDDLNIDHLNIEEGRLQIKGVVASLVYTDKEKGSGKNKGLWNKLWR